MKLQQFLAKCSRYPGVLFVLIYVYCSLINLTNAESTWDSELENKSSSSLLDDIEIIDFSTLNTIKLPDKAYHPKIKSILIKSRIRFRYARTRIITTIVNPDPTKSHEVNFRLRIPKEAFISKFEMRIDGGPETYKANVTSSENATKMFEFAKSEGKSVSLGLIEQSIGNFDEFSMKFIIGAQKTILFLLVYEERIPRTMGKYESVIHLIPEQLSNKTAFRIEITIEETEKITSINVPTSPESYNCEFSYANATIENQSSKQAKITWSNKMENSETFCDYPNKEFTVSYSLEDEMSKGYVLVRNGYFVHFFNPSNNFQPLKKHVVFVLDISDSMVGKKLEQLQKAMIEILDELKYDDFFNIIAFSTNVEVWSLYKASRSSHLFPFPANEQSKDSATHFVKKLIPHGSTNIHLALTTALQICKNVSSSTSDRPKLRSQSRFQEMPSQNLPDDVQSMILFFTDGEATSGIVDKQAILTSVKILNYELAIPIFSLAFGDSADSAFLADLSQRNRAFARKVYEEADASLQLADFYREISSPILANLSFKYATSPSSSETQDFKIVNFAKSGYPMIFKGTEIIVVGKLERKSQEKMVNNGTSLKASVSGNGRSGKISYNSEIRDCTISECNDETDSDDKSMEKLFVYLTIKNLQRKIAAYRNGNLSCWTKQNSFDYYDDWYEVDNPDNNCANELQERVVQLAMQYGFVTPYTSLVMKTKSILEEEMDVDRNSVEENNTEWELFLGNVNPLSEYSKLTLENSDKEIEVHKHQELPKAQALTGSRQLTKKYNIVEIHKNSTFSSESMAAFLDLPYNLIHFNSSNHSYKNLTLNNVTWLTEGQTVFERRLEKIYTIDENATISNSKFNLIHSTDLGISCTSSVVTNGTCKHLATCVQPEFLDDYQAYMRFYYCPLRYDEQTYLGVCCPKQA